MRDETIGAVLESVGILLAAVVLATPAMSTHSGETNVTVQPETPDNDRAPGETRASYEMWVQSTSRIPT